jgi:general stress protein YciG
MQTESPKKPRGFAAMSPEKRKAIAALGGKAVPSEKRSFSQSKELAVNAGRAGGLKVEPSKRAFARDTEAARRAGQKGGLASRRQKTPVAPDANGGS